VPSERVDHDISDKRIVLYNEYSLGRSSIHFRHHAFLRHASPARAFRYA
jgi:hypothetical protein